MTRLQDRLLRLSLPWRIAATLLASLLALGALRSSVVEWNDVASPSMRPSVLEGDRILVWKLAYDLRVPFTGWTLWRRDAPRRGDLVVFDDGKGTRMVKRVIGLPGDRVEVREHAVFLDDQPLPWQPAADLPAPDGHRVWLEGPGGYTVMVAEAPSAVTDSPPLTVPPGRFFLMGDNRSHSLDSRQFGTVPRERVVGRAVAVVVSFDPEQGGFRAGRSFVTLH